MLHVLPLKLITAIYLEILSSEASVSDGWVFGGSLDHIEQLFLCSSGIYIYCHVEILVGSGNTQIKEESISMFAKL